MDLLKMLFIILLFTYPTGEILRLDLQNNISVKLNDLAVGILFAYWLVKKIFFEKSFNPSKYSLLKPIAIFSIICLMSLVLNFNNLKENQLLTAILYLIRWLFYGGLYFVVSEFNQGFKKTIIKIMIVVSEIVITLGYVQYLFYPNLRNLYYLGWDEHNFRMFSTFLDPNFAGSFFVLSLILLTGYLVNYLNKKEKIRMLFLAFLLAANLVAIYLTFSRSAILMFIVGLSVMLILNNKKKLVIAVFLAVFLAFIFASRNFYIENLNLLRIASSEARFESAKNAIKIIKENSIFGVGFNAYRYAQVRYGFRKEEGIIVSHADAGTDNSFLFISATTGLVGLFFYLYLWFRIIKLGVSGLYCQEKFGKMVSIILLSSTAGLFINALFINSLFFPFIMEWIWILVGLTPSAGSGFKESS